MVLCAAAVLLVAQDTTIKLFDGKSLAGWHQDVPSNDGRESPVPAFIVRDGVLVSLGEPRGHLITNSQFENYRLTIEYRFVRAAGNTGILVHASIPRFRNNMLPRSLEVQLMSGNAGDFYMLGETIRAIGAASPPSGIRLANATEDSERPIGEWNTIIVECVRDKVTVWVNDDLVNQGEGCSSSRGQIALQSEGTEVEFRRVELQSAGS